MLTAFCDNVNLLEVIISFSFHLNFVVESNGQHKRLVIPEINSKLLIIVIKNMQLTNIMKDKVHSKIFSFVIQQKSIDVRSIKKSFLKPTWLNFHS